MTKFAGILVFMSFAFPFPAIAQTPSSTHLFTIDARRGVAPPETGYLVMGSDSAGLSPDGSRLAVDSRSLLLDGTPWLPVMGEFHYSRCPRKYWEEELLKMKAGGIQIVSTYIFWIHHEEIEGEFDWSDQRDLRAFVELCARHGLYVYPRIGPWAHGEARNGGFPDWLLEKGPTRVSDSTFFFFVNRFYAEIGKQLRGLLWKDGGPVVGIQIENEYANRAPNGGTGYLLKLKAMAITAGLDVPLYTVTGWDNAVIPPREFIPVYGGYPDEAWSGSRQELPPDQQGVFQFHVTTPVGTAGIMQAGTSPADLPDQSRYPRFTAEMGGGMEDTYHRRVVISPDDVAAMALSALGSGVNLLGYYMFHGGTNPDGRRTTLQESQATGYPNDVPVKSYDFQAPLGEFGQMNGAFRKLKVLHQFLHDFGSTLAPMTAMLPDIVPSGPRDTTTLRISARTEGNHGFIFFNNYVRNHPLPEQRGVQVRIALPAESLLVPRSPVTIPPQSWFFWPVNLDMNGALLKYATAQPMAYMHDSKSARYFFIASPLERAEFVFDGSTIDSLRSGKNSIVRDHGRITVRGVAPSTADAIRLTTNRGKEVHIVLLSGMQSLNCWKLRLAGRERMIISTADLFADGDTLHVRSRDPKSFQISMYPPLPGPLASNVTIKITGRDGIFTRYAATVTARNFSPAPRKVRDAGIVPPAKLGQYADWRKCSVAVSPDDTMFEKASRWELAVPKRLPAGISNLFLAISYAGDAARVYDGDRLLDDNFFNGTTWEIGLKRYLPELGGKGVALEILPLRRDAPLYIPRLGWPSFKNAGQIDELKSASLVPEYEVMIYPGRKGAPPPSGFLLGADISFLAATARGRFARLPAYQEEGKPGDELSILAKHGWKAFRLRLFLSPVRMAPENTLENTIPLAKRIKSLGALFCLDLHFSDTWADPQHQEIPAAWRGLSIDSLERRVEIYSRDVISRLKKAGAMPEWVQIGNEITRGTLWPLAQIQIPGSTKYNPPEPYDEARQWDRLIRIIKAAIRGVRAAAGSTLPRIAMHIDQGGNWPVTKWFFDHLEAAGVEYDIIAESFYPEWRHGTLEGLRSNMLRCANRYDKDFLVAETGYDSSRVENNDDMVWPVSPSGRLQFMADLINTVRSVPHGIGVMYWAPEWGVWNPDGSPGPTVFVLDSAASLSRRPQSHVPSAIVP